MNTNRHESENDEGKLLLKDEVNLHVARLRVGVLFHFKHPALDWDHIVL